MSNVQLVLLNIQKDIKLPPTEINNRENIDMEVLRSYLVKVISELLDKDFNRLIQAMYRIDISENEFKSALSTINPEGIPEEIANLVIKRELEKVESRKKYS